MLINAAGAWADELAHARHPDIPVPSLERVQGSHIVLPAAFERGVYYLESPRDGRAVFADAVEGSDCWSAPPRPASTAIRRAWRPAAAEMHYLLGVLKALLSALAQLGARTI